MTLISYKYKFIFLANMKCASTSIHRLLSRFADEAYTVSKTQKPLGRHATAREVKKYIRSQGYKWKDFYVFTTIRHPLDRIRSCYRYEKILKRDLPDFEEYVLSNKFREEHFQDIRQFAYDYKRLHANKVLKVEFLNDELKAVIKHLKLPITVKEIPHMNRTKHTNSETLKFSNEMIEHLRKELPDDFKMYES